jgi:hypothetical protein
MSMISEKIVTTRVWKCDGLNCPTAPATAEADPFYAVTVSDPSSHLVNDLQLDLCPVCILTMTAQPVTDWLATIAALP